MTTARTPTPRSSHPQTPPYWFDGSVPPWPARLLSHVYAGAVAARAALFRHGVLRSSHPGRPVVVVGNLIAGGSGKTPLVIALVEALRARGFRPGVVSRGHGGSEKGPLLVDDVSPPSRVGDEPCLIRRRTGAPVAIGRDRARAAALLLERGVDVVIADDGLQNPSLARELEICVIDGQRRFGNGLLLPAGPLREPLSRLQSIALRVCNGGAPQAGETPMRLVGETAVAVSRAAATRPLGAFAGQAVHAVAAIGNPGRFFAGLRAHGIEVVPHAFPDHHPFSVADLAFGDDLPVLMTEKDAVKCTPFATDAHWCVPVRAELPAAFFDSVVARLPGPLEGQGARPH